MPDPTTKSSETLLRSAQDEVSDVFASIAEFWGFTRTQGRIYGLLLVSDHPLTQSEIRDRLQISAGSTSMTLSSLLEWGVVDLGADRTYRPQSDLWKAITGVMRRRERAKVDDAIARMQAVARSLEPVARTDARAALVRERCLRLLDFFRLGRRFLDAFVTRNPLHGLLDTIARRAADLPSLLPSRDHDVRIGV